MDNISLSKILFNNNSSPNISDTNLNLMQTNTENGINALGQLVADTIGLGDESTMKRYTNKEINYIDTSCFAYLNGCTCFGETINNGYLLTLLMNDDYRVQFYTSNADDKIIKFRKKVNTVWKDWIVLYDETINLSNYLKNSWETYGQCIAELDGNGCKHISACVINGTSNIIAQLPEKLKPTNGFAILPAVNYSSGVAKWVQIAANGQVTCHSSLLDGGNVYIVFSGSCL